jgi:cbb3-type cytochrome oxidase maturation protein
MTILLVLIPLGLMLLGLAIGAFVWAVRHGQLEDLEGEGLRILLDDDAPWTRGPEKPSAADQEKPSAADQEKPSAADQEKPSAAGGETPR